MPIGPVELVIILVIALLILGPGKLPDVGEALGKSIREFRRASSDIADATRIDTSPLPPAPQAPPAQPIAPQANQVSQPVAPNTLSQPAPAAPPSEPAPAAPPPAAPTADTPSEQSS